VDIDLRELMYRRGRIFASTLRMRSLTEKAAAVNSFEGRVLPLLSSGSITVPISASYPWEAAHEAYRAFTAGGKFGKLILCSEPSGNKE
jgi:NADPH:quinone reductase-like Zn-dependent oxidoreductase